MKTIAKYQTRYLTLTIEQSASCYYLHKQIEGMSEVFTNLTREEAFEMLHKEIDVSEQTFDLAA